MSSNDNKPEPLGRGLNTTSSNEQPTSGFGLISQNSQRKSGPKKKGTNASTPNPTPVPGYGQGESSSGQEPVPDYGQGTSTYTPQPTRLSESLPDYGELSQGTYPFPQELAPPARAFTKALQGSSTVRKQVVSKWTASVAEKKRKAEEMEMAKAPAQVTQAASATPAAPWLGAAPEIQASGQGSDPSPAEAAKISAKRQKQEVVKATDPFSVYWKEDEEWRATVLEQYRSAKEAADSNLVDARAQGPQLVGRVIFPRPDGTDVPLGAVSASKARSKPRLPRFEVDGFIRRWAQLIDHDILPEDIHEKQAVSSSHKTSESTTPKPDASANQFQVLGEDGKMIDEPVTQAPEKETTHKEWSDEIKEPMKEEPLYELVRPQMQTARQIAKKVKGAGAEKVRNAKAAGLGALQGLVTDVKMTDAPIHRLEGMSHPGGKLTDIMVTPQIDVKLSYRKAPDTTDPEPEWSHVGGIYKTSDRDYNFKVNIDAGHLGTPSLNFQLKASINPSMFIESAAAVPIGTMAIKRTSAFTNLRFPTGDYCERDELESRYSLKALEYQKLNDSSSLWKEAQLGHKGSKPLEVIKISFTSDGNFLDHYDDCFPSITSQHSEDLRKILTHLRVIHNMKQSMEFEFFFIYRRPNVNEFFEKTLTPLQKAVNGHLPQYFPYYDAKTGSAVADTNLDLAADIGDGMYKNPRGTITMPHWAAVKRFDNVNHYLVTNSTGRVREDQDFNTEGMLLAQGTHHMWVVKPSGEGSDTKWKAYVKNTGTQLPSGETKKPNPPADGTFLRMLQTDKDESEHQPWAGYVKHVRADELNNPLLATTDFDFLVICNSPWASLPTNATFDNYESTANQVDDCSQPIKLKTPVSQASAIRGLEALKYLGRHADDELMNVLLGRHAPDQEDDKFFQKADRHGNKFLPTLKKLLARPEWNLNNSQVRAIQNAYKYRLSLIQGPPGTGKTWTIGCLAWSSVINGRRVMACASSNAAVDEITRKLELTMPSDMYPVLKNYPIVRAHTSSLEMTDVRQRWKEEARELVGAADELNIMAASSIAAKKTGGKKPKGHYQLREYSLSQAIMDLAKNDCAKFHSTDDDLVDEDDVCFHFRRIMDAFVQHTIGDGPKISKADSIVFTEQYNIMVQRVLDQTSLVLSTCNNAGSEHLVKGYSPDIILVDEAAQCPEIDLIIPLCRYPKATRWVLCGDHKQIAPICPSRPFNEAANQVVYSAFERFFDLEYPMTMLNVNYRSTKRIMEFMQQEYYEDLECHGEAEHNPLVDFVKQWNFREHNQQTEVIFVDVPNGIQVKKKGATSWYNAAEAKLTVEMIASMLWDPLDASNLAPGVNEVAPPPKPEDIGVIVPYSAQVDLVRSWLQDIAVVSDQPIDTLKAVEVSTVDSFQGREKPIIIASFVATNSQLLDGKTLSDFLVDNGRLCVTLSRARYGLIILGNGDALRDARFGVNFLGRPKLSKLVGFHKARDSSAINYSQDETEAGLKVLEERRKFREARQIEIAAWQQRAAASAPPPNFSAAGIAAQYFQQRGGGGRGGRGGSRGGGRWWTR